MKIKEEITVAQAKELINELILDPGDSFTNMETSDLHDDYLVETGYWLSFGKSRLVHLSTKKDSNEKLVITALLELNDDSLGFEEDDKTDEHKLRAEKILNTISVILEKDFILD
jgi:hypothetical protein